MLLCLLTIGPMAMSKSSWSWIVFGYLAKLVVKDGFLPSVEFQSSLSLGGCGKTCLRFPFESAVVSGLPSGSARLLPDYDRTSLGKHLNLTRV